MIRRPGRICRIAAAMPPLIVSDLLVVPDADLTFNAIRSPGPGGQNQVEGEARLAGAGGAADQNRAVADLDGRGVDTRGFAHPWLMSSAQAAAA